MTIIAGNWKMHMSLGQAQAFFESLKVPAQKVRPALFTPAHLLLLLKQAAEANRVLLGAQTCHWEEKGAYTGEISPAQLATEGIAATLVGHSERRHLFGESDEDTARKTRAALEAGLTTVLCVGETLDQRRQGNPEEVVVGQLEAALEGFEETPGGLWLAYEPVWAIGTGEVASPEQAAEMHLAILNWLEKRFREGGDVPVLYGGSVKPENAQALLASKGVGGLLIGGASLKPEDFTRILELAAE